MQTLISELIPTFIDDTAALIKGFGRALADIVTAPIERIARASDVAGVLARRRSPAHGRHPISTSRRAGSRRKCPSPFGSLSQLT